MSFILTRHITSIYMYVYNFLYHLTKTCFGCQNDWKIKDWKSYHWSTRELWWLTVNVDKSIQSSPCHTATDDFEPVVYWSSLGTTTMHQLDLTMILQTSQPEMLWRTKTCLTTFCQGLGHNCLPFAKFELCTHGIQQYLLM